MLNVNHEDYGLETTTQDLKRMTVKIELRLQALKRRVERAGVEWITEKGKNFKKEHFPFPDPVYWNGADIQVIKNKEDIFKCFGYSKTRIITNNPYFMTGLMDLLAQSCNHKFVRDHMDVMFRYMYFEAAVQFFSDERLNNDKNLSIEYVLDYLNYFQNFVKNFYTISPMVETELFEAFMTTRHSNFYFAYGSNMNPEQMEERCPGSDPVGIGYIDNYRTIINERGVATIVQAPGEYACGILWAVSDRHIRTLDEKEGIRYRTYLKTEKPVKLESMELPALVYIAAKSSPGTPRSGYLEKLIKGADHFKLGDQFVNYLNNLK
ncbi:gamma-glutamylcyclotransferase [Alphaproteobacteria bacterium]|nr:gamma-glutamylcyclotransferase [Alphaproteobacteria bacterium]